MTQIASDIVTLCAGCGLPMDSELPSFQESVNLTPDLLMIGRAAFEFGVAIIETDDAWDWCSLPCFGRWLFNAVVFMAAGRRP